jgi:hypothetical protein
MLTAVGWYVDFGRLAAVRVGGWVREGGGGKRGNPKGFSRNRARKTIRCLGRFSCRQNDFVLFAL